MNVANRKLFANRDARKKLAEMGGILASSPELLGEAQKFAEAGQIDVQMYVINVPGLTAPGEYLKVSEETLMQLNDIVPQLMSQQETLVEPAEAVEGLVDVRPGDALLPKRLRDIGAIPDQAPVPTVQEPVDDRSIRDIVREGLESSYSIGPGEALSNYLQSEDVSQLRGALSSRPGIRPNISTPDSENPMVQMVESGLQSIGVEDPNAALLGPNQPGVSFSQLMSPPTYNMTGFGGGAESPPEPTVPEQTVQQRTVDTPAYNDLQRVLAERRVDVPGYNLPGELAAPTTSEPQTEEEQSIFEMVTQNPLLKGAPGVEEETLELLRQKRDALNIPGLNMPSDSAAAAALDAEIKKVGNTPEAIAAAERLQMTGFTAPKISAEEGAEALQSINEQIKEDPTKLPNKFVIDLMKKNEDAYREAAFGKPDEKKDDGKAPPKPDPEKVIKMSSAEATNEYYKQLKELFGLSDEDKARDLSLTMAQFGFAMAAGQSPNALTNIANAAGAALAQMRESQATEREREDKLKLLAFTEARADEKEARELERLLAKETRADKRELALYISKLQAKAALDPDVKTYLETPEGKAALGMYKDIIGNEYLDADEVVSTFIQQAGDLAPDFLKYLGLGAETGGNAGGQDNDQAIYNKIDTTSKGK
jgi:hypothetical protein